MSYPNVRSRERDDLPAFSRSQACALRDLEFSRHLMEACKLRY